MYSWVHFADAPRTLAARQDACTKPSARNSCVIKPEPVKSAHSVYVIWNLIGWYSPDFFVLLSNFEDNVNVKFETDKKINNIDHAIFSMNAISEWVNNILYLLYFQAIGFI